MDTEITALNARCAKNCASKQAVVQEHMAGTTRLMDGRPAGGKRAHDHD